MKKRKLTLVAIGSNAASRAGHPEQTVKAAIDAMVRHWGDLEVSSLYQTPAFPAGAGPDFVNAACAFFTTDSAQMVLSALHQIEAELGRVREKRWGQRTLDLDLIAQGDVVLPDPETFDRWQNLALEAQQAETPDCLILPHPRVQDRSFVLVPLADVAPNWTHPRHGQTTLEMLDNRPLEERQAVIRHMP